MNISAASWRLVHVHASPLDLYLQQTKVYQHSCYNTQEAYNKLMKSKEKVETARSSATRRRKAQEKELEVYSFTSILSPVTTPLTSPPTGPTHRGSGSTRHRGIW